MPPEVPAQNNPSSGLQHTLFQDSVGELLPVQVIPSGDVITRNVELLATAQNKLSSGLQHTDCQPDETANPPVQVIPSGDVITRNVGFELTAQNSSSSGLQQIERHEVSSAALRAVHVTALEFATKPTSPYRADNDPV
jgi:hypothetical protein